MHARNISTGNGMVVWLDQLGKLEIERDGLAVEFG